MEGVLCRDGRGAERTGGKGGLAASTPEYALARDVGRAPHGPVPGGSVSFPVPRKLCGFQPAGRIDRGHHGCLCAEPATLLRFMMSLISFSDGKLALEVPQRLPQPILVRRIQPSGRWLYSPAGAEQESRASRYTARGTLRGMVGGVKAAGGKASGTPECPPMRHISPQDAPRKHRPRVGQGSLCHAL
jgi:hypothetical protein